MLFNGDGPRPDVSVIIPVRDEAESLGSVLECLKRVCSEDGAMWEIIVVDDCSIDESVKVVEEQGLKCIKTPRPVGYGGAIKKGFRTSKGVAIGLIDGDGTYSPHDLPRLLEKMRRDDADMVVGARQSGVGIMRRIAKWFITKLANYLTGSRIADINSGIRIMKRNTLSRYIGMLPNGFSFTATLTMAAIMDMWNVTFVPVSYGPRRGGRSKIRPVRDTLNFVQLVIRMCLMFEPTRVFNPAGAAFLIAAGAKSIIDLCNIGKIAGSSILLSLIGVNLIVIGFLADLIVMMGKRR